MYIKQLTLILLCLGISSLTLAQCPTNITFNTQEDIDSFSVNYPGCTMIPGDVVIGYGPDYITNLNGLSGITSIGGSLNIFSESLQNLVGLSGLTSIGGDFHITTLFWSLTSLDGIENLTSIGGFLYIDNNYALMNVDGLSGLTSIGGNLYIELNTVLVNLDGLSALTSIGGLLYIYENDALTSVEGLYSLSSIGGGMSIRHNPELSMCFALCPLLQADIVDNTVIDGNVIIGFNAAGCSNLQDVQTLCNLLPIEMTNPLRVRLKYKTAILEWRTALEINNSGFEIQRSRDGIEWEKIGWQNGQGNTSTAHRYTYADRNPLFGTSYYRLRQVDFNGDTEYSNIVSLQYIHNGVTVYPNPVKEQLYLHVDYNFIQKITIYNSTGSQATEIVNPNTEIDVSALPKGIYVLKISADNEDFYEKILVE